MTNQEINEAVARKLGYRLAKFIKSGIELPLYATDIQAAWEIVENLKNTENCCLQINSDNNGAGCWIGTKHSPLWFAKADTAPLAICLAFLKLE